MEFNTPPIQGIPFELGSWFNNLFKVLKPIYTVTQKTTDPTTTDISKGMWGIYKNTTSGVLKLWVNDNGTMKSVTIT